MSNKKVGFRQKNTKGSQEFYGEQWNYPLPKPELLAKYSDKQADWLMSEISLETTHRRDVENKAISIQEKALKYEYINDKKALHNERIRMALATIVLISMIVLIGLFVLNGQFIAAGVAAVIFGAINIFPKLIKK